MRSVLGIDAAWTRNQPSGVALAVEKSDGWRLIAAVSSYQRFLARASGDQEPEARPSGSTPDANALLSAAKALCEQPVDLVAIDMPLALSPIMGRRVSDNEVSRVYGARWCSTHTPNATRPGLISNELRQGFGAAGYPLRTTVITPPGLIEVYPHPALVELTRAEKRLPYKAAKIRKYWRDKSRDERHVMLLQQWSVIADSLEERVTGVVSMLPKNDPGAATWQLKAYEDALDAIVCAWVAICALEGRAAAFGDEDSAIWIPIPGIP